MLYLLQDCSVTDFLRSHKELITRVTETQKPVVLTMKRQPALEIQDTDIHQELLDNLERSEPNFVTEEAR